MLAAVLGKCVTRNPNSDRAARKGCCRLLERDPASNVASEHILAPHRARSNERLRSQKTALCIQDGSRLDYATRTACTGLQINGRNQTKAGTCGMHLHTALATITDGPPRGVLACSFRDPLHGPLCHVGNVSSTAPWISVWQSVRSPQDSAGASTAGRRVRRSRRHGADRGPRVAARRIRAAGLPEPGAASAWRTRQRVSGERHCRPRTSTLMLQPWMRFTSELAPPREEKATRWFLVTSVALNTLENGPQITNHVCSSGAMGTFSGRLRAVLKWSNRPSGRPCA